MAHIFWVLVIAVCGAGAAEVEGWVPSGEVGRLRDGLARFRDRPRPGLAAWDAPDDLVLPRALRCAPFGAGCASSGGVFEGELDTSPINAGFQALGQAGATGGIDGPGRKGNGRYRILKNDPYEVSMELQTGYINGVMTLRRDQETGKDQMIFRGRRWDGDKDRWGDIEDKTNDVVITYNARHDCGKITWKEDGESKEEGFWEGRAGRKSMVIEMGGGYNHHFEQD